MPKQKKPASTTKDEASTARASSNSRGLPAMFKNLPNCEQMFANWGNDGFRGNAWKVVGYRHRRPLAPQPPQDTLVGQWQVNHETPPINPTEGWERRSTFENLQTWDAHHNPDPDPALRLAPAPSSSSSCSRRGRRVGHPVKKPRRSSKVPQSMSMPPPPPQIIVKQEPVDSGTPLVLISHHGQQLYKIQSHEACSPGPSEYLSSYAASSVPTVIITSPPDSPPPRAWSSPLEPSPDTTTLQERRARGHLIQRARSDPPETSMQRDDGAQITLCDAISQRTLPPLSFSDQHDSDSGWQAQRVARHSSMPEIPAHSSGVARDVRGFDVGGRRYRHHPYHPPPAGLQVELRRRISEYAERLELQLPKFCKDARGTDGLTLPTITEMLASTGLAEGEEESLSGCTRHSDDGVSTSSASLPLSQSRRASCSSSGSTESAGSSFSCSSVSTSSSDPRMQPSQSLSVFTAGHRLRTGPATAR